jgi:LPXTG-motif cell wall-anchored protein
MSRRGVRVAKRQVGIRGLLVRVLAGIALVVLTFNPAGLSYFHWALADLSTFSALKAVPGVLLLCGWVLYIGAAFTSLGWLGLTLAALVFASLVWLLFQAGVLRSTGPQAIAWIALIGLGLILGLGLSWSILRRRITGQVDVDTVRD